MATIQEKPPGSGRPPVGDVSLSDRVQALRLPTTPQAGGINATTTLAWVIAILSLSAMTFFGLKLYVYQPTTVAADKKDDSESTSPAASADGSEGAAAATPAAAPPAAPDAIVLESKGYIVPEQQILVSPQVSGRILGLRFREGMRTEKGAVLAILDDTEYRADYERARATVAAAHARLEELRVGSRPDEIAGARAELAEAEAQVQQNLLTLERTRDLFTKKVLNKQELEDAEAAYATQSKRVDRLRAAVRLIEEGPRVERKNAAEAELRQAEADLTRSKWRLDNCTIYAPISGTILKKNAEEGNIVNPVAFNGSFSLCDIADLSKLEVDLSIQERDISKVYTAQKCRVRAEAFPKRTYQGVVSRLMPIADRAKGSISVRVRLIVPPEEEGIYLKPEMGAIVTFLNDRAADALPAEPGAPADASAVTK